MKLDVGEGVDWNPVEISNRQERRVEVLVLIMGRWKVTGQCLFLVVSGIAGRLPAVISTCKWSRGDSIIDYLHSVRCLGRRVGKSLRGTAVRNAKTSAIPRDGGVKLMHGRGWM